MPTDGTLLLEHMPHGKKYLVTALSVFFSFGAVLAAVVALLVVPQNSCSGTALECDVGSQNQGWKYLLITLGLIVRSSRLPLTQSHWPTHCLVPPPKVPYQTVRRNTDIYRHSQCSSPGWSFFVCMSHLAISSMRAVTKKLSSPCK